MFRATTATPGSGGGTYYTAWHTYSTAYSNTYSATASTYQVRALRPLRRQGRVELFRDAAMMQRRGRMLLAPSWRRRCHSSLPWPPGAGSPGSWPPCALGTSRCAAQGQWIPNGRVRSGREARQKSPVLILRLASLNTQARPLRGRFRSQARRRGRRHGGAAAQQEETLSPYCRFEGFTTYTLRFADYVYFKAVGAITTHTSP